MPVTSKPQHQSSDIKKIASFFGRGEESSHDGNETCEMNDQYRYLELRKLGMTILMNILTAITAHVKRVPCHCFES